MQCRAVWNSEFFVKSDCITPPRNSDLLNGSDWRKPDIVKLLKRYRRI